MFESKIRAMNRTTTYNKRAGNYSIPEIQELLSVSRPTVYKMINEGHFQTVRKNGHTMITKGSFDAWLDDDKEEDNGFNI